MDERYERERQFHDKAFSESTRQGVAGFYAVADNSFASYRNAVTAIGAGRDVLEYGCGQGTSAFLLAKHGARVTAIDISEVAIRQARDRARADDLKTVDFRVMNAEKLEFEPASFDLVCGVAILHHLDLPAALSEIRRTLRPSGTAVFLETLGHNPLINLYRRATPQLRTPDEHPLLVRELEAAKSSFQNVELRFFNLSSLAAVPFRSLRLFAPLRNMLHAFDSALFATMPITRRYAWQVLIVLSQPRDS